MAILLVRVDEPATLQMNEFFDYDGSCWALSRSRYAGGTACIRLEDFYDSDIRAEEFSPVTAVFVCRDEENGGWQAAGWYRDALVYRKIRLPSLFLEGNIKADARNCLLLPQDQRFPVECSFVHEGGFFSRHRTEETYYEVIESMDSRYDGLMEKISSYKGANDFLLYAQVSARPDAKFMRSYEACIEHCTRLASDLMGDRCTDIRQIKEMLFCAEKAVSMNRSDADGFYYLAMAAYHLGQVKKAIKAVNKAEALEPDAGDILALKASILVSMGHTVQAADLFHEAWMEEGDEDYLVMEGRTYMNAGQMDKAHACFSKVEDASLLEANGINLKDMEKKWPFMNLRGISLGKFRGKNES